MIYNGGILKTFKTQKLDVGDDIQVAHVAELDVVLSYVLEEPTSDRGHTLSGAGPVSLPQPSTCHKIELV